MYGFRPFGARAFCEKGFDVDRIEPVRSVAELAGDGHRALLVEYLAHLLLTECTQETGHPALGAAAFEAHWRAAEEPQVTAREPLRQELLDGVLPERTGGEL